MARRLRKILAPLELEPRTRALHLTGAGRQRGRLALAPRVHAASTPPALADG